MTGCIFCDILAGQVPASFVYRDDICTAFMDIQPVNTGHLLVVPNRHATCLADASTGSAQVLPPETGAQMFRVAQQLAAALRRSGVRCEGVNIFLADGSAAGQEVFHVHLHVIPRWVGDGFGLRFGPVYGTRPPRAELEQVAQRIRTAL
jgi:histidine triad (HIT) family protein